MRRNGMYRQLYTNECTCFSFKSLLSVSLQFMCIRVVNKLRSNFDKISFNYLHHRDGGNWCVLRFASRFLTKFVSNLTWLHVPRNVLGPTRWPRTNTHCFYPSCMPSTNFHHNKTVWMHLDCKGSLIEGRCCESRLISCIFHLTLAPLSSINRTSARALIVPDRDHALNFQITSIADTANRWWWWLSAETEALLLR